MMVTFIETNKQITETQHWFHSISFCLTNLSKSHHTVSKHPNSRKNLEINKKNIFNDVYESLDVLKPYNVIYLDFQQTFDTIPHNWLSSNFRAHGIGEYLCAWIGNWLSDGQQRIVLSGEISDWPDVTCGATAIPYICEWFNE